ncbi:hypothetical protein [Kineococcus sp. SYSU DK006]|uniref:hypothetical protein n=1 Tax=Kineococcus sp. SYSU DK006 TaxID=3383127 RepID=UPI003D7E22E4
MVAASTLAALTVLAGVQPAHADDTPPAFGTLMTSPDRAAQEYAGGMRTAMLELSWKSYEPRPGEFNTSYISYKKSELRKLREAGLQVSIGLGMHYAPDWAKTIPNSAMVDQYGTKSSSVNLVFNRKLRDAANKYMTRVDADLGLENFYGLRVTSGGKSELLYPGTGSYYAFDANAQGGADLPSTMARNPMPGWKPGTLGTDPAKVLAWKNWYIGALVDVARWQMGRASSLGFHGHYQMLMPGYGARPSAVTGAVNKGLPNGIVGIGAAWTEIAAAFKGRKDVTLFATGVADNSGGNGICQATDASVPLAHQDTAYWSSARWLTRIARENGLKVAGENPGYGMPEKMNSQYVNTSSTGMMAVAIAMATSCDFEAFYWAHDNRLFDGTVPFSLYSSRVKGAGGHNATLAWPSTV